MRLRPIAVADLPRAAEFVYTLSITEPMIDLTRLTEVHAATGFWLDDWGALAIEELATGRLLGTTQFYRSGPCIHGFEIEKPFLQSAQMLARFFAEDFEYRVVQHT